MSQNDISLTTLAEMSVLIVDDDKTIRDIIMQNLRFMGIQRFLHAGNGSEAFKKVADKKNRVDLILCDWDMPVADGLTLLKMVRGDQEFAGIPFIMVTAQQTQERVKISQAAQYGVDAYVVKPFQSETLRKKVLQVLSEHYKVSKNSA
jgi:CheY-like chemotaxis protein